MEGQAKLEDQQRLFEEMLPQCTGEDLKYIIRLIRSDLRSVQKAESFWLV
eukprot:m.193796 g.193796  ORF g.193796 m.193796 type:complete len:50 (-) comp10070_c0_seq12:2807-2956(-)